MSDQKPTGDDDTGTGAAPTPDASSDAPATATPGSKKRNLPITTNRIVIWIIGGGIAIYLIVSGVIGIITKGQ